MPAADSDQPARGRSRSPGESRSEEPAGEAGLAERQVREWLEEALETLAGAGAEAGEAKAPMRRERPHRGDAADDVRSGETRKDRA